MPIPTVTQTPAQLAAQELVDKANVFIAKLESALANGVAAEGNRPVVSAIDLHNALGNALAPLQAIINAAK